MCLHSYVFLSQIQGLADLQILLGKSLCFCTIAAFCVNGNKNMKRDKILAFSLPMKSTFECCPGQPVRPDDAEVTRMQSDLWLLRRLGLICDRKLLTVWAAHTKGLCCWHFILRSLICGCEKARTLMTQWNALLSIVNLSNDVVKSKRLFGCECVGGAGAESLATPGLAAHRSTTSFRLSSRCVRPDPLFQSAVDTCSLDLLLPSEHST